MYDNPHASINTSTFILLMSVRIVSWIFVLIGRLQDVFSNVPEIHRILRKSKHYSVHINLKITTDRRFTYSQAAYAQKMPKSALLVRLFSLWFSDSYILCWLFSRRSPKIWAREDLFPVQSLTLLDGEPPKILENPKISDIRFIRHQGLMKTNWLGLFDAKYVGTIQKNNFRCKKNQKPTVLGDFRGFFAYFCENKGWCSINDAITYQRLV